MLWRRMWEWMYRSTFFLTSALVGGEWSVSRPGRFTHGERAPGTYWIGGWVNPRAGLDDVEKRKFIALPGLELRPLGRPARSQSLYWLRYPGSLHLFIIYTVSERLQIKRVILQWDALKPNKILGHEPMFNRKMDYLRKKSPTLLPGSPLTLVSHGDQTHGYCFLPLRGQCSGSCSITLQSPVVMVSSARHCIKQALHFSHEVYLWVS
jgi:hypothetical protein